jgi:predicted small secreted protein
MRTLALRFVTAIVLIAGLGPLAGCDNRGTFEEAGEDVDEVLEDAGEAIEDAGEEIEDALDDPDKKGGA